WAIGSLAAAYMSIGLERTLYRPAFVEDEDQFLVQHEVERKRHGVIAMFGRALEHVTGSRLVLALLLLAFVLQVASRVGDYLVAVIFVAATHNNLQELTILIGNAWLASYAVQLGAAPSFWRGWRELSATWRCWAASASWSASPSWARPGGCAGRTWTRSTRASGRMR